MTSRRTPVGIAAACLALAAVALLAGLFPAEAGNPFGAYYSSATDRVFWFIHVSDPHIGASGTTDSNRLRWVVTTARSVIDPAFVVATGDLTDSTAANIFGYPNGPHQSEWDEYKGLLAAAGAGPDFFYDLPGNHDAYNDRYFAYYRANSVQGRATGGTQLSWVKEFPFGSYHFLGVNTADNTGNPFSIVWPYGDYAGLDDTELSFIRNSLTANAGADLTFVFGHHPVTDTGGSQDTWLYYGHRDFVQELGASSSSTYNYGHTHAGSETLFDGDVYTGAMPGPGVHYYNVSSLGKEGTSNFSVVAVDCNGVSSVTENVGTWPVVLITAPVDAYIGAAVNPYAYPVPASAGNPLRALVFDAGTVTGASYRVDGAATWTPMQRDAVNQSLWVGQWDASGAASGDHTIEVRAVGTTTRSNAIRVKVEAAAPNLPPVAADDAYAAVSGTTTTVAAPGVLVNDSDPESGSLAAVLLAGPGHGTLTLGEDGSFTYRSITGYEGPDAFTYRARDAGGLTSNTATVAITVTAPPVADTVGITAATYTSRKTLLSVTATSSAQPKAVLTVVGYGVMTYKAKSRNYTLQVSAPSAPSQVMVTSDLGGSATKAVTIKR